MDLKESKISGYLNIEGLTNECPELTVSFVALKKENLSALSYWNMLLYRHFLKEKSLDHNILFWLENGKHNNTLINVTGWVFFVHYSILSTLCTLTDFHFTTNRANFPRLNHIFIHSMTMISPMIHLSVTLFICVGKNIFWYLIIVWVILMVLVLLDFIIFVIRGRQMKLKDFISIIIIKSGKLLSLCVLSEIRS